MRCEDCGDSISLSSAYRDDGNFVCEECHINNQQHQQGQSRTQQRTQSTQQQQAAPGPTEAQTERTSSAPTQRARTPRADTSNVSSEESSQRPSDSFEQPAPQKFKTLLRLGKFISGCGWLIVVVGVIGLLISFTGFAELADSSGYGGPGPFEVATAVGFFLGSLLASGIGLVMAAAGQQISCFVAIERNTRSTLRLIQERDD